jgi:hypothetical protein
MVKEIKLTQGKFAIVDDEDYEELIKYKWYAHPGKNGTWYAQRDVWYPKIKKREKIAMHREIMKNHYTKNHNYTDHINHDGLDNRRCNLRVCTNSENMLNQKRLPHPGSIWWDNTRKKWNGQICVNYKKYSIGRFTKREDAEKAMVMKAKQLFGDFFPLNAQRG